MTLDVSQGARLLAADWPPPGPIDLAVHDLPHASSVVEWWYVNSHLTVVDGRNFSLFAAFFRVDLSDDGAPRSDHQHFLAWALADPAGHRYLSHTLVDRRAP